MRDFTVPVGTSRATAVSALGQPADEAARQDGTVALVEAAEQRQQRPRLVVTDHGVADRIAAAASRSAPKRSSRRCRREWARTALRASLATMRSNHDRTGASPRHDRSARWPFTNASCTMSLASSVEPQMPAATRSAADWWRRTSSPYAPSSPARARRTSTSSSGAVTPGAERSVLLTYSAALYRSDTAQTQSVPDPVGRVLSSWPCRWFAHHCRSATSS